MRPSRLLSATLSIIVLSIAAVAFHSRTSGPQGGVLTPAPPLLEPRSGHTATLLPDGRVLIAGGMRHNQDFYRSAELYDPSTGKSRPTGAMSIGRVGQIAIDPANEKFTTIARMTVRRGRPSATMLASGDVLIAGGEARDNESLASAEIFRVQSLSFQPTGSMHHARIAHTATLLNDGRVLVAGGYADGVSTSAEIYDPKSGSFTETGSLQTARCKHTAGLLPDGRVLIAGGSDNRGWNGNLSTTEVYDPRSAKVTSASSLNDSRFKLPDEAVRLSSGRLLVAGGSKELELYDPASGKFLVAQGEMSNAWHYQTETRLKDGSVLLTSGYPNNDKATAEAWIYKP